MMTDVIDVFFRHGFDASAACRQPGASMARERFSQRRRLGLAAAGLLAILALLAAFPAWAAPSGAVIILDPGHGGLDPGAALGESGTESVLVMAFAEKTAKILEEQYGCTPVLTRAGDYGPGMGERAGAAASRGARLFISFHAGPGWGAAKRKALIAYFESKRPTTGEKSSAAPDKRILDARPWDSLAQAHLAGSQAFAGILRAEMQGVLGPEDIVSGGYPFAILAGVDAPAVLVELSSPQASPTIPQGLLDQTAQAIGRAVRLFLDSQQPIP